MLFFEDLNVFVDGLLIEGIPEPEDDGEEGEADGGDYGGDVEDTVLYRF